MEKLIACCGLDCATCDARIATVTNDDDLRKATAEKWKAQFNLADLSPEMINCTGCREEGAKISNCAVCEVRNCVQAKNYATCADCNELDSCAIVAGVLQFAPDALDNLKSLN